MLNSDYGILQPWAFLSIPILLLTAIVVIRGARLRQRVTLIFKVKTRPHGPAYYACMYLVCALLGAALLRPYWGSEDIPVNTHGEDVIFLVDVSRSMFAQDVPPSRIELAKRKLKDIISSSAIHGHANRFGITLFAGDSYTVCPLTADTAVVKQFIDVISPELVTSLGSNLEAGISNALSRLDKPAAGHSRIVLLSDGEDGFLDQTKVLEQVTQKGVRLDVIGIGTPAGSTVKLPNGQFIMDASRKQVISQLGEGALKAIAAAGRGTYVRVTLDDTDINALVPLELDMPRETAGNQSTFRNYREFGPWFVLASLLILLAMTLLKGSSLFLAIVLLTLSAQSIGYAESLSHHFLASSENNPYTLYESGEFEKAADEFTKALQDSPQDRGLKQGLASALFKQSKYKESQQLFHELAESAKTGREYFENIYNEGNTLLGLKRYSDALDAYGKALDIKPNDPRTLHNLRVARALWEEEKNAPTPTPTPTPTPASSSNPSPNPSPSPDPSASTTPSPAADQTQQPSATAGNPTTSPEPTGSPSGTQEPHATAADTASPQATSGSTPSTPLPSENQSSPSPTERQTEATDDSPQQEQTPAPMVAPTQNFPEQPTEAEAWLQSLPDSPLLIRRHKGAQQNNGQTW